MAFATLEDYSARYGEQGDGERAALLLEDASNLMLSAFEDALGEYAEGKCAAFDRNACAVCCLVVNRVLTAPAALAGATQYSQGAGTYTASVTYGSALGEMYVGRTELKRLGLLTQSLGSLSPLDHAGEA